MGARGAPLIGITADFDAAGPRAPHAFLYAEYFDAVRAGGGLPVLLPALAVDDADPIDVLDSLLDRLDGVVFSGGDDMHPARYGRALTPEVTLLHPRREAFELALARRALARGTPLLGLCNGIQTLNVACGGTLVVHLQPTAPGRVPHKVGKPALAFHAVELAPGSQLADIFGAATVRTNTYHHQAVDAPGEGVEVIGRAPDGVIEAIELPAHPFAVGVQWHPEKMPDDPRQPRLFAAFAEAARARREP